MAELGNKSLGGATFLNDAQPDIIDYPKLHLNDNDALAVPNDAEVGDERPMKAMVRISSLTHNKDGSRSVTLEVLDATVAEKPEPSMMDRVASKFYPNMGS